MIRKNAGGETDALPDFPTVTLTLEQEQILRIVELQINSLKDGTILVRK